MTLYLNDVVLVLNEDSSDLVQQGVRFLLDLRLAGLELDTLHCFLEQLTNLTFHLRTTLVRFQTRNGRTQILIIGYTVFVGV